MCAWQPKKPCGARALKLGGLMASFTVDAMASTIGRTMVYLCIIETRLSTVAHLFHEVLCKG